MPLMPKRMKWRKAHRRKRDGVVTTGCNMAFGEYGLQAMQGEWITGQQIEACRVAINRAMKRKGKLWIRIFPDLGRTKKPLEVRMGKGRGNVDQWVAVVRPGRILFEMDGVTESVARRAMKLAAAKLPVRTRFVQRHEHA